MQLTKLVILAMAAVTLQPTSSIATTEEQKQAAIQNLAMISMAKKWCSDYQIDQDSTVAAALLVVDITKEPYSAKFIEQRTVAEKLVGQYGTNVFCLAAFKTYGPESGMNLMMKK